MTHLTDEEIDSIPFPPWDNLSDDEVTMNLLAFARAIESLLLSRLSAGAEPVGVLRADPDDGHVFEPTDPNHWPFDVPLYTAAPAQSVPAAMAVVTQAMRDDPEYAWSWHCNVAMASVDEGVDPATANHAAARFMRLLANVEPAHELPAKSAPTPAQAGPTDAKWHKLLADVIDIYFDGVDKAPEDRCYVAGAIHDIMKEARDALRAAMSATSDVKKEN